jgi:predicted metallopeptidase
MILLPFTSVKTTASNQLIARCYAVNRILLELFDYSKIGIINRIININSSRKFNHLVKRYIKGKQIS